LDRRDRDDSFVSMTCSPKHYQETGVRMIETPFCLAMPR
jgi:hypothetical protein